jgi:hypothetical protein
MRIALATLAMAAVIAGCTAAEARAPRFPDPLPPHTKLAYAQSYGGFVGGHAFVILKTDGAVRYRCRFDRYDRKARRAHVKPSKWNRVLEQAHLEKVKSDAPGSAGGESPQLWILYKGRVTYLESFAHRNGYPQRAFVVEKAFERYLSNKCRSS